VNEENLRHDIPTKEYNIMSSDGIFDYPWHARMSIAPMNNHIPESLKFHATNIASPILPTADFLLCLSHAFACSSWL
jgi:hypothetical protein